MAEPSPTYKYMALSATGWLPAYGYPEGWSDPEWTGFLSKEYVKRYSPVVTEDVRVGAPKFRRVVSYAYVLENRLLDRHVPETEAELRELIRDTLLYFAAKYIIRDLYLTVVADTLKREFGDNPDIFALTRSDITTVFATDPRYADIAWDTTLVKIREYAKVDRFAPERYVRKYKVLWDMVMAKGAPPEIVIKYLAMIYVHDEAQAFAHREDFATFNAVSRIRRAMRVFGITDSHLLSRGWLAYDGTKVLD